MNIDQIISSGLLESYVLGTATHSEVSLVQDLCSKNPSLITEIEAIESALITYSSQATQPVNAELKNKIIQKIFSPADQPLPQQEAKIIPIKKNDGIIRLYKLGIAASVIFFVTSVIFIFSLQEKVKGLNNELAKANSEKTNFEEQLNAQQTAMVTANSKLQILSDPKIKTIGLKGMNSLASTSALVHWNTATDAVYFNAAALPASPNEKQYQLWAIVDGKPVDVGMIDLASDSTFQKMKSVKNAQAFAVTIEKTGGSPTPTMDTMCLLGNV